MSFVFDYFIAIGLFAGIVFLISLIAIACGETTTGKTVGGIFLVLSIVAVIICVQVGCTSDDRSFTKVIETHSLNQIQFDYQKDILIYASDDTAGTLEFKNLTTIMVEDENPYYEKVQKVTIGHAEILFAKVCHERVDESYIVYVPRKFIVENAGDYDWSALLQ